MTQAFGKPGFPCPPVPIPHSAPNASFGCFADTNGVVLSPRRGGYLFTANGGSDDVSVIDVTRALAGDAGAEVARIPVGVGPWGIAVSPDGGLVAVANRESARTGAEGNTISIIDVEKAIAGAKDAEVARLLLGTNNPTTATRPYAPAFTPDGRQLVVTHFRTNNVSIVDVAKAVAGEPAEIARIPLATPGGGPSRPRGVAITAGWPLCRDYGSRARRSRQRGRVGDGCAGSQGGGPRNRRREREPTCSTSWPRRGESYTRSIMAAMPWPTPMHIVHSA